MDNKQVWDLIKTEGMVSDGLKERTGKMWLLGEIHPLYGEVVACGSGIAGAWRMFMVDGAVVLRPLDSL